MFQFLIPAAASLIGGSIASSGAKSAAATSAAAADRAAELQRESAREATDLQRRVYEEDVARQQPYYQAGVNALAQVQNLAGQELPQFRYGGEQPGAFQYGGEQPAAFQYGGEQPAAFKFDPSQVQIDPGYQFRLSEGLKALERSAAARGGLLSGATGKALTRYGQEMGSQEFQNAYGRAMDRSLTEFESARQREAEQYGRALTGYNALTEREQQQYNRALTGYNALAEREQQQYNRALGQYNLGREQNAEMYNRLAGIASGGSQTASGLSAAGRAFGTAAGNIGAQSAQQIGNIFARQGDIAGQAAISRGSTYGNTLNSLANIAGRYYGQPRSNAVVSTPYDYGVDAMYGPRP